METLSPESVRTAILALDPHAEIARRFGRRVARKMHGVFGRTRPADVPLGKVYIDHTQLDVHLAQEDRYGRLEYAGRPYFTLLVDDHCSMPLGWSLSLERPKTGDILAAIRHAILPKAYTQAWVGNGLEAPMEAMGIFSELWGDNGLEITANAVFSSLLALGTSVVSTPVKQPWTKGREERMFGTFNTVLAHQLHGTTFGTSNLRHLEYDGSTFACLEFPALWKLLHIAAEEITTRYNKGIDDIPLRRWREGVRRFPVELPIDAVQFDADLSLRIQRVIGRQGIEFEGLYFSSAELEKFKHSHASTKTFTVCVCPENVNYVYILSPEGKPLMIPCVTAGDEPLSLAEHRLKRRLSNRDAKPTAEQEAASARRRKAVRDANDDAFDRRAKEAMPASKLAQLARQEAAASPKPVAPADSAVLAAQKALAASRAASAASDAQEAA